MAKKTNILLVVEGEKREVELIEKLFTDYQLEIERNIYVYGTNIYDLYERVFLGNENDMDNIDFLQKLKEKEPDNQLFNQEFSDILLIFDYDPQDNRFAEERIMTMLAYFSESTENGKLYINYPMLESYKHFKCFPDPEYKTRTVNYEILSKKNYKTLVNDEAKITGIRKYNRTIWNEIIKANIQKQNYILNGTSDLEEKELESNYFSILPKQILHKQNERLKIEKEIYVLNTAVFFICDYNFNLIYT